MLIVARQALADLGLIGPETPTPPFFARMSGNLGLTLYLANGEFVHVKLGLLTRLDREYRGLKMAHSAMPRNVPEPLGLTTHDSHQVLVSRGVPHKVAVPMHGGSEIAVFRDGIDAYFASAATAFRQSGPCRSWSTMGDALAHVGTRIGWVNWEAYGRDLRRYEAALPSILQHGDFAVNNIGVHGSELIYFDWEDFGEVDLPDFDLAVLLLSLCNFDISRLIETLSGNTLEADIVRRVCPQFGASVDDFMRLFPAYVALYIESKSRLGYPSGVTDRIAEALTEWLRLGPARCHPR